MDLEEESREVAFIELSILTSLPIESWFVEIHPVTSFPWIIKGSLSERYDL